MLNVTAQRSITNLINNDNKECYFDTEYTAYRLEHTYTENVIENNSRYREVEARQSLYLWAYLDHETSSGGKIGYAEMVDHEVKNAREVTQWVTECIERHETRMKNR